MPALNRLYIDYRERAAFYVVYVQEAHPIDGWQLEVNRKDDVLMASTHTLDERCEAAQACVLDLGIELPALVDEVDDRVERAYTAWPDRLYVIDRDGRVAYKSDAGPFGFEPAAVDTALKRLLSAAS